MRTETKLCVTCHNPGSWFAAGSSGTATWPKETVDFKVMIHKIHHGDELPSVLDPDGDPVTTTKGSYKLGTHDFSDVAFPQDIRNCTKCHDGTAGTANVTTNGDNWKTMPSKEACGSCHDNVYFGTSPNPAKPYQVVSHMTLITNAGGTAVADPADSLCISCHASGQLAGSIEEKHVNPVKAIAAKFKYNLISVTGGTTPVIQFSVTDPTNADAPYNITTDPAFTQVASGASRIALVVGWSTTDFANTTSGVNPALPITVFPTPTCGGPASGGAPASADWACTGPVSGVYTLTKQTALPADATGTGRVAFEGHPAALNTAIPPAYTVRVPVKNVVKDWSIDGSALKARRTVVDIAKCNKCHDQLSLHGNNRTDEPQVCVMCHNPNATDTARRPVGAPAGTLDNKKEEAIDFKRMIHGIHGAEMRTNGIVVYGFGGSANDFSGVRFPGILNDCATCHTTPTSTNPSYQLSGIWETPTENGILGTTIDHGADLTIADDDLNITPTAAVCSSCHDGALTAEHMRLNGAVFAATQLDITDHTALGGYETCAICHGPGAVADVKVVHGVK